MIAMFFKCSGNDPQILSPGPFEIELKIMNGIESWKIRELDWDWIWEILGLGHFWQIKYWKDSEKAWFKVTLMVRTDDFSQNLSESAKYL